MLPVPLPEAKLDLFGLNERQRKAVEYVRQHGSIRRAEYARLFGVSERQASRDLDALIKNNILARQGKTSSAQYVLGAQDKRMS